MADNDSWFAKIKQTLFFWQKSDPNPTEPSDTTWDTSTFTRKALLYIVIIGAVGWVILSITTSPVAEVVDDSATATAAFDWATAWLYAVVLYTIASYRFWSPVPTGEQAALTYFGKPIANVGAGPAYAPLFVFDVLQVTAQTPQREFPAEPELIDRTELKDGYEIPDKKRPPLRIQFRDSITKAQAKKLFGDDYVATSKTGEKIEFVAEVPVESTSAAQKAADGLSRRVTAEVQHVARIRVDDPSLFFTNVPAGDTGDPLDEAFRQIEDESVKVLTQYFTRMSVAQALMNIRWISIHLHNAVDLRVGAKGDRRSWGVDVQAAFVKLIHTDHGLNIAISEAAQAPFNKTATITAAEGEKEKRILEGRGAATAARDLQQGTLEGRAKGLKKLADTINVTGEQAQAAEVARSVGEGGNTIVVGTEGFGQLAGVAAAALGKKQKPKAEPTKDDSAEKTSNNGSDS